MNIFTNVEVITEIPKAKLVSKIENVFVKYDHRPNNTLTTLDEFYETFRGKDKRTAQKIINNTRVIKYIYAKITYPLKVPALIKFTCNDDVTVTYGLLLYAYTKAYQLVYDLEHTFIKAGTYGKFGIWGHAIGDLVYNCLSTIETYDTFVVCIFDCDS